MDSSLPPQTHLEKLKVAALCLSMQKGMHRAAWGSIAWGAFTLIIGLAFHSHGLLDYLWLGIGAFLVVEGLWLLLSTTASPSNLLLEALALAILGLWNTVGIFLEYKLGGGHGFTGRAFFVGIAQLASAYATYASYPAYKAALQHVEMLYTHELEEIAMGVWKAEPSDRPDIAEFTVKSKKCKARFLPEYALLISDNGRKYELLGRSEISIQSSGEKLLSKSLNVTLRLATTDVKTQMKPDQFERWQAWASQATSASVVEDME